MTLRQLLVLSACLVAGPVLADDKWEVTTSFEMTGMPFQMPPQTQTVCLPPGQQNNEKMVPADKSCTVANFTTTGNTSRFRIECPPPQQMTGEGEITRLGTDAYKGTLKAKTNTNGMALDMKIAYAGHKIGSCAASENVQNKAKAAVVQQQAQVGQMCQQFATNMSWQMAGNMAGSCPTLKADICKTAKAELLKAGSDPDALRNLQEQRGDWRELAKFCGVDPVAIDGKACTTAKQKKIWGAVAQFCGSEAEALAGQYCTGRSYTVVMASEYGSLCEKFSSQVHVTGGSKTASAPTNNDKVNQAIDGINKLRGLFGK